MRRSIGLVTLLVGAIWSSLNLAATRPPNIIHYRRGMTARSFST